MIGLGLCVILAFFAGGLSPLVLGSLTTGILIIVTIWEYFGQVKADSPVHH
jgi:hypothetical protein